jgi:ribose transport system permease protein
MTGSNLQSPTHAAGAGWSTKQLLDRHGLVIVILCICAVIYATQPELFLSWRNITNILKQTAINAVLAAGVFLTILTAGIDLSVGSILMLSMMTMGVASLAGAPLPVLLVTGPLVGIAAGLVNGLGITKLRMPHPFIMTLGMLFMARGLGNVISGGVPITGFSDAVRYLGNASWTFLPGLAIPVSAVLTFCVYGLFWLLLSHSVIGRRIYALGGNPQAVRVTGLSPDNLLIFVYAVSGAMAGLGALLLIGRTGSAFPTAGVGSELEAIAACIIGGASFFGGRGSIWGVLGGALTIGLINNGLNLNNVSVFWQQIMIGAIVVVAVYIDVLRRRFAVRR